MKKVYQIEELCCAHCAAKMEDAISALPGVDSARVNFLTQKVTLEADEALLPALARQAADICKKIEPDCTLILK